MKNKTQLTLFVLFVVLSAFALVVWVSSPERSEHNAGSSSLLNKPVGEIVAADLQAAKVFSDAGIDFCCHGRQTLKEACSEKGIHPDVLLNQIESLKKESLPSPQFNEWEATSLITYITDTHHQFLREKLPDVQKFLALTVTAHGQNHKELYQIKDLYARVEQELLLHLEQEEELLFPSIRGMQQNPDETKSRKLNQYLAGARDEHNLAGGIIDQINMLSNGYRVPGDGCNTYRHTYQLLKELEDNLHVHIHLENNILFPKAESLTVSL